MNFINFFLNNSFNIKFPKVKLHFVVPIKKAQMQLLAILEKEPRSSGQDLNWMYESYSFLTEYLPMSCSIIWYPFFGLPFYFHQLLYFWFNEVSETVVSFLMQPRGNWQYYHFRILSGFNFLHFLNLVLSNEVLVMNKINKWQIILPFYVN